MADINRTSNNMALPSDISSEIIQKTQQESAIMRLARRVTLPGRGLTIPVITGDPTAEWVAETAAKPVSNPEATTKLMAAYKIAVIETFSKEFARDAEALYDALIQRLPAALAAVFDKTVIGGTQAPGQYFDTFANCTAQSIANANNGTYLGLVAADGDIAAHGGVMNGVAMGAQGRGVQISVSDQASVVSGQTTINLWQQNMVGVLAEIEVGFRADTDCFNLLTN